MIRHIGFFFLLLVPPGVSADLEEQLKNIDRSIRQRDYSQAIKQLKKLSSSGEKEALFRMGSMYRYGRGVSKSLDKAMDLYLKAAQGGHVDAQYTLASLLEKKNDPSSALQWYRQAAQQGHDNAAKKLVALEKLGNDIEGSTVDAEAVFRAVLHNDKARIQQLVRRGYHFNIKDRASRTPLLSALMVEHKEIARQLLSVTSDVQHQDKHGNQAIHIAVGKGYHDIVKSLLAKGANVNVRDRLGNTPLIMAVRRDDSKMVTMLLRSGANYKVRNKKKKSVLDIASARGSKPVLRAFKSRGISIQQKSLSYSNNNLAAFRQSINASSTLYKGWPILNIAALLGEDKIIKQLLGQGVDVNTQDETGHSALHRASGNGNTETTQILLKAGAEINALTKDRQTPLYLAARSGHVKIVKMLLAAGADASLLTVNEKSALQASLENRFPDVSGLLVDEPLNDESAYQSLLLSIRHGYQEISLKLISSSAPINRLDSNGRSVLWYAVEAGQTKVVATLLNLENIHINKKDTNGYSPLAISVVKGHETMARILLANKANLFTRTNENNTLLMLAVLSESQQLIRYFADLGIDVSAQDNVGDTALMLAADRGQIELVELLIELGADIRVRNKDDLNAYMIAENAGHKEVAELIRKNSDKLFKLFN